MWRLRFAATLAATGCLPALTPAPDNAIDAHYRASPSPPTTVNQIYGWIGERSLAVPSRCRMLPTDSEAFAIRTQRCGGLAAWYWGIARLMLEQAGDSRFTTSIRIDGRARWIDLPRPVRFVKLALALLVASTTIAAADDAVAPSFCDDPAIVHRLATLVHARRFADAHHAVVGLRVGCGDPAPAESWRLIDDIALLRLEDRVAALRDLRELADHARRPEPATVVLGWAYAIDRDRQAAQVMLARLPAPRAAAISALASLDDADAFAGWLPRLSPEQAASARALFARYDDAAHTKHPALAGVLSAMLPGAGQIYSGSLQAAALTFVLNALFISTTVEQARDHHYATAAAAVTVASFFYVGGVINAVDLARRRNRIAAQPDRDALELLLVPEIDGAVE